MKTLPLILVCDDDEDDQMFIRDAFAEAYPDIQFRSVHNGAELLEYLQNSSHRSREFLRPDIILLDLNMPLMGGLEALNWIKSHITYRAIPVVVYTTSTAPEDVAQCYTLGANSYMTKCASFDKLVERAKSFSRYWIENALLPKKTAG
jgi:CheY-like chemotaxis protein